MTTITGLAMGLGMGGAMDNAALLTLARWFSPAFPTGGFAWSHGLETLVAEGAIGDAAGVEAWLADVLAHGGGRNDAILLAAAWRARPDALAGIAELAAALAPGAERARETLEQGAAFARLAAPGALPPDPVALPVVVGAAARAAGLPLAETLLFYLQNLASTLVSVAVRHVPLGQSVGQGILARLAPAIGALAEAAPGLTLDDLGGCAFAGDLASLAHETQRTRIFRS